jgi:HAD superfamily hydrolase (TIGR01662 family)
MTDTSKIKAEVIVFDQGNTLVLDPFQSVLALEKVRFEKIYYKYGIPDQARLLNFEWTRANRELNYPFITHFSQEEPIIQMALRKLDIPEDIAALLGPELLVEYRKGLMKLISIDPRTQEVKDTLSKLQARGKRLGVFSNDRAIGLGLVLEAMKIRHLFQYIETSEFIGIEKPDPRVFSHILDYFQVNPENLVYVGDDPVRDIEPAKRMGLKAIQYKIDVDTYNETWRDYRNSSRYLPDAEIDHFSQILEIIG